MKHQHYAFSKKALPASARRITNAEGRRVWLIDGMEFPHKRAYFTFLYALKKLSKDKPDNTSADETAPEQVVPETVAVG